MKKILSLFLAIFFAVFLVGSAAYAQTSGTSSSTSTIPKTGTSSSTSTVPSSSSTQGTNFDLKIKLNNPLKVDTVQGALAVFMNAVVRIAIPFIIVFMIWSGFNFIMARGNPKGIEDAKRMFFYTLVGALLILGAWTITNVIVGTVNSVTSDAGK